MYQTLDNFLVKTSGRKIAEGGSSESVKKLMLIHGWGMSSQVWEPIREALEARYHIIWVDLPGHGFNRHIKAENFENIVKLISRITPEKTHVLAWSLGGMVAQSLSQKNPDKIKSMTLIASTPRFSQSEAGDWPHAMSDTVLNRFADNLKQDAEKTIKGFIALQFIGVKEGKQAQDNLINQIIYNGKSGQKVGGVFLYSESGSEPDSEIPSNDTSLKDKQNNLPSSEGLDVGLDILKNIDLRKNTMICPEHWLFGEYDRLIPKEVINDLKSLRPDAEITHLEKTGHAPFITQSEDFLKRVTRFVDALD